MRCVETRQGWFLIKPVVFSELPKLNTILQAIEQELTPFLTPGDRYWMGIDEEKQQYLSQRVLIPLLSQFKEYSTIILNEQLEFIDLLALYDEIKTENEPIQLPSIREETTYKSSGDWWCDWIADLIKAIGVEETLKLADIYCFNDLQYIFRRHYWTSDEQIQKQKDYTAIADIKKMLERNPTLTQIN